MYFNLIFMYFFSPKHSFFIDFRWQSNVLESDTSTNRTQHRKHENGADTHSDGCRNSHENTSLKCKSGSALLSGCRLAALALAGRYLWAKSLKNKTLSLCRKTCRQTGGFEGPQPSAAQRFEADWKLCFMGLNESKRRKLWKAENRGALLLVHTCGFVRGLMFKCRFVCCAFLPCISWGNGSMSVTLQITGLHICILSSVALSGEKKRQHHEKQIILDNNNIGFRMQNVWVVSFLPYER